MKALRIVGVALATVLLFAGMLLAWAVYSESGARSVLAWSRRWLPAGLTIAEVRGTIAGTLHIRKLRYHDAAAGMDLLIDDAELEFAALALLSRRVHVQRMQVGGVHLDLFDPTPESPAGSGRDPWVAPLDLQVDELRLARGELRRARAPPLVVSSLHLVGSWLGPNIVVRTLRLESPDGQLALSGRLAPPGPRLKQLSAEFRWRAGEHEWAGVLAAQGARDTLAFDLALRTPMRARLSGTLANPGAVGQHGAWHAHVSVPRFDPRPLIDTDTFDALALELDAEGDLHRLALQAVLSVGQERVLIEKLNLVRDAQALQLAALRLRLASQPGALTGSARLALDAARPSSAELSWDEVRLPDGWAGANLRCSGHAALAWAQRRYALNGMARIARAGSHSTLTLRIDGSPQRLHVQELELTQIPGALSVVGDIELGKPLRWTLDAHARAFDPSLFLADWPGALDFDLGTQGHWPQAGPHATFRLAALSGKLRGRAISGAGDMALGPDLRPSGRIRLQSGDASLEAVASSGGRSRIDAKLRVASLGQWQREWRGALEAEVSSLGHWPDITLDGHISAREVRHGSIAFDAATLRLRGADARAPRGSAELRAQGVELGGFAFQDLSVALAGDARSHHLKLDARGEPLSLALHASGSLAKRTWAGTLEQLALDLSHVPPLQLAEATRLSVAPASFELGNACLRGGDIELCARARHAAGILDANYSIRALPVGLLVELAAPRAALAIEGVLGGAGDLHRAADGTFSGRATLDSATGSVSRPDPYRPLLLEYRDFGMELDLTRDGARARLRGVLPRQGELEGALTIALAESDPTLAGRATLKLHDLAPLAIWVPQLADLVGSGELAAEVAGTLRAPSVGITVRAEGLDAEVPALGVHLREGSFNASLEPGGRFRADGSIRSGEGLLRATGTRAEQEGLALELSGSHFLATSVPGARVILAPDLTLAGKGGALALTGAVTIVDADVNLEKLSFARSYRPSSDVIVVDRETPPENTSLGLSSDVRVILGDQVKLAGFGLDTTVSGELRVLEEPGHPGRATGEIRLMGTYEAFGRKLSIERGRLQFAGTSLDDPQLDILAERKLQDVTAKLRVTGTAQHPRLDVFTDPASTQTDAMSYLLTGKPASEAHGEEGALVSSAAQSLGSVLGNRLARRLGDRTSFVDEIGVEQNADLGGDTFTVGKFLSPRFFISYGVGLFEPGTTMTVRYVFTKHWSLEANQAPKDAHAGIRYRIEK